MKNRKAGTAIDALERARAELETALKESADWRALRRVRSRARRVPHEQALARNPVYRAWTLLSGAIEEMRAGTAAEASEPPGGEDGAIRAGVERTTRRRRIGLREVLERVRSEAVLDRDPIEPAVGESGHPPAQDSVRPAATPRIALTDPEEAAVSFVVREPVARAAGAEPLGESSGQASAPDAAFAPEAAGRAAGSPPAGSAEDDEDGEAEVVIVPRSR